MKSRAISLVVVCSLLFGAWSCNVQSTIERINSIIAAVTPAVQIIVNLLPLFGANVVPENVTNAVNDWAPRVQADLTQLGTVIQQYQSDLASPTAQEAINAVVKTTQDDILGILPVFRVLDKAKQDKIVALVNSLAAAVQSVEAIVNAAAGKVQAQKVSVTSGNNFKAQFNAALHASSGDASVDQATKKLSLK